MTLNSNQKEEIKSLYQHYEKDIPNHDRRLGVAIRMVIPPENISGKLKQKVRQYKDAEKEMKNYLKKGDDSYQ